MRLRLGWHIERVQQIYHPSEASKDGSDERTYSQKQKDLERALSEADNLMQQEGATPDSVREKLPAIELKYRLVSLTLLRDGDKYYVKGEINPKNTTPPRQLVASIEELVADAPPEVRGHLIAAVKSAQDSLQKAMIVEDIIKKGGGSMVVKRHKRRTGAVTQTDTGLTVTVSGFGQLTNRQKEAVAKAMGVELSRNVEVVQAFYESHKEEFAKHGFGTGYAPIGHMSDPKAEPGKHHLSHAEKQAEAISGATALGVSKAMCTRDCRPYFYALAKIKQQAYTIADPEGTYIFYPSGLINFLPHSEK